ncbi:MAG: 16S rRNA (cytosine(1402)-N(4))-methyltransferase RsmH, partial [Phaeodactylibacter sp.]|nr:16S rRNA (cytosine(1402)-N(4))-methyltransferase RsmH [Phaeodactylibacter sp.]
HRLKFFPYNFRYLKRSLRMEGVTAVDGILADLGVSSHQFDTPERGFSFRFDAELDMRMGQQGPQTAAKVLNTYDADQLQTLFSRYGEVRNARTLAAKILEARQLRAFETIEDLVQVAEPLARGNRSRYLAQVFQALRIEVNDEMGALAEMLQAASDLLGPGGRFVVISYHSLEDRMVKNFFKTGNIEGEIEKDFYGNIARPFRLITKKARMPEDAEIARNPRARSARLRVAEKPD